MCFIRNKAPQTECTDYPFLPQFFDMCFDIMGRVYGIGINANMVSSFSLIQSALAGMSRSFCTSLE